jgi:hypothetical protein
MPEPRPHHAALAERTRRLGQTRTITLGIAGGAALASLGLGTAFAHALPGHSYHASYHPAAAQGQPGGGQSGQSGPAPSASSSSPAHRAGPGRRPRHGHRSRHHHAIAPPTHAPAPAPSSSSAPPPVTSGGT